MKKIVPKPHKMIINGNVVNVSGVNSLNEIRQQIKSKEDLQAKINKEKNKLIIKKVGPTKQNLNLIKQLSNVPDRIIKRENVIKAVIEQPVNVFKVVTKAQTKKDVKDDKNIKVVKAQQDEIKIENDIENIEGYYTKQYNVIAKQWYIFVLTLDDSKGVMKILDSNKKSIYPTIKFPNILFGVGNVYKIYVKATTNIIYIHLLGSKIINIDFNNISPIDAKKNIDVWKMRKAYDLHFLKYYLSNIKFEVSDKFVQKVIAEYDLLLNPNYFDNFKIDFKIKPSKEYAKINVLYLTYPSIEYEEYGYTVRSHNLLKNVNGGQYKVYGTTRYGYPYDKDYGTNVVENKIIDGVEYIKLLNGDDNFNTNNLVDYLKKYIMAVIQIANKYNAKVIHATTHYWNGIAAIYAAKFLGIKTVYEIRGFLDEAIVNFKDDFKDTDIIKMMNNLEIKVCNEVDQIITINQSLNDKLIENNIDVNKIIILYNAVDTTFFKKYDNIQLRRQYVDDSTYIIGYIGSISYFEGLEYIIDCIKKLVNVKFMIVGEGMHKKELLNYINKHNAGDFVIDIGKIDNNKTPEYYNIFDIVAYPRKNCVLCQTTCSYKVFEAMATCRPIIVSDLRAWREVLIDGETGIFCKPDDVDDLFEKLKMLFNNKELRERIGNNAREWVISNREWKSKGKELRDIYDKLLEN